MAAASDDDYGNDLFTIFPARDPEEDDRSRKAQAAYQFAYIVVTLVISIGGGYLTAQVAACKFFNPPDVLFSDDAYWEVPALDEVYAALDLNDDQQVDESEVIAWVEAEPFFVNKGITGHEVMQQLDLNHDGFVSREELTAYFDKFAGHSKAKITEMTQSLVNRALVTRATKDNNALAHRILQLEQAVAQFSKYRGYGTQEMAVAVAPPTPQADSPNQSV